EQAVATDPALAQRVKEYEKIFAGLRRERLEEIEEEIEEFIEELPIPGEKEKKPDETAKVVTLPTKHSSKLPLRWIAGAAAAIALLLVLFWPSTPDRAELVANYLALPEDESTAGASDPGEIVFDQAEDDFFSGRYAAAAAAFQRLLDSTQFSASARYYLPFALHQAGDLEGADQAFSTALADNEYPEEDRERLRWNAMLNDLARGEDITTQLAAKWSTDYQAAELRKKVAKLPDLRE
ncbi:MAG: hypothetical protein AAFN92_19585, partial [Bacteroidota bacterium]